MGEDKALIAFDGVALAARVRDALAAAGCDPVVCQGGDAEGLARLGLRVVADTRPGSGPLPAILDALAQPAMQEALAQPAMTKALGQAANRTAISAAIAKQ